MPDVDSILPTVSIHTPIQGVTLTYDNEHIPYLVSIHTPIQGVTRAGSWLPGSSRVSIHTPIQGVTKFGHIDSKQTDGFNPHTHTGCDLTASASRALAMCFNPHTHTGCDAFSVQQPTNGRAFQSTHPYRV